MLEKGFEGCIGVFSVDEEGIKGTPVKELTLVLCGWTPPPSKWGVDGDASVEL